MVNYCIVSGCGRNNKNSKHLYFYSLPKEPDRQVKWLKAAERRDLLKKSPEKRVTYRICSRHFSRDNVKNKHLCGDAVPTLCLPGLINKDETTADTVEHEDIVCNNCYNSICGFRYKCVYCLDYDLCSTCETLETHSEHYMIRIPKPLKFKTIDDIVKKMRKIIKMEDCDNDDRKSQYDSSDDEPITKYVKNDNKHYDSGIDLSEDVKSKIRREVDRVLKLKCPKTNNKKVKNKLKRKHELSIASNSKKRVGNETKVPSKKAKLKDEQIENRINIPIEYVPEVAFADVNEINTEPKPEINSTLVENLDPAIQPVMHMKLSDDLTELMIEMSDQKTIYKF